MKKIEDIFILEGCLFANANRYAEITKDIAIKFAEWRNGTMYNKEKGIDGKEIIRQNYPNYYGLLFEEFLKTL